MREGHVAVSDDDVPATHGVLPVLVREIAVEAVDEQPSDLHQVIQRRVAVANTRTVVTSPWCPM